MPAGLKAEQGATVGGLAGMHVAPRVARCAGEVDPAHKRVGGQVGGDAGAVGDLALHAQGHGLQAPERQPAIKGAQAPALRILLRT